MQATRDGPVPVGELILEEEGKHHEVALWREAVLAELALLQLTEITHLNIVRNQRKKNRRGIVVVGVSVGSNTTLLLTEDMEKLIVPHNVLIS
ncbi:hypothetical protein AMEX_G5736 [Astyanax mexicanus]|uniref:Uncharacterized protein n=1 Tax=Astyanax mexicanus TaxID=7994 RepID=A0A8T2MAP8_ASTMX|nr:hypothetical protein AMEX_G5736 [Astyanax mexicanus]